MAVNNHGTVVELHQTFICSVTINYQVGYLNGDEVDWSAPRHLESGRFPKVVLLRFMRDSYICRHFFLEKLRDHRKSVYSRKRHRAVYSIVNGSGTNQSLLTKAGGNILQ